MYIVSNTLSQFTFHELGRQTNENAHKLICVCGGGVVLMKSEDDRIRI